MSFGILDWRLWDTGTELFETRNIGTVWRKEGWIGSLNVAFVFTSFKPKFECVDKLL